jgi:hypothetical protein
VLDPIQERRGDDGDFIISASGAARHGNADQTAERDRGAVWSRHSTCVLLEHAMRSGHAPGHVRDTFLQAIQAFADWDGEGAPPTVCREIKYAPHQISIAEACGLVWNCTDILPGSAFDAIADLELPVALRTYAAAARAMLAKLKEDAAVAA